MEKAFKKRQLSAIRALLTAEDRQLLQALASQSQVESVLLGRRYNEEILTESYQMAKERLTGILKAFGEFEPPNELLKGYVELVKAPINS